MTVSRDGVGSAGIVDVWKGMGISQFAITVANVWDTHKEEKLVWFRLEVPVYM